jgi:glycosyltransferase involved in cell wall biosynthesis
VTAAVVSPADPSSALLDGLRGADVVVIARQPMSGGLKQPLMDALASSEAATASPVPLRSATAARAYPRHPHAPSPSSLPLPCPSLCAISRQSVESTGWLPSDGETVQAAVAALGAVLLHHGWRHVVAPGVAFEWDAASTESIEPTGGWSTNAVASLAGPANTGLEAHVSWADASLNGVRVVVDGACMSNEARTGTQHLVLEIARWLARTRPDSEVALAVPAQAREAVTAALWGDHVSVVLRSDEVVGDVLYRPYQMLRAGELPFVMATGRRALVGQLDMIGFANPSYHPSEQLLFFARNIQRELMRNVDGVTFISEFGRRTTLADCPDLDPVRLHVVSCGADPVPSPDEQAPGPSLPTGKPFLVCLASTFWHKNRTHAIRTFAALTRESGFPGYLVIAGPEPYFGRSLAAEAQLLSELDPSVARRVLRLGHVPDAVKWWLLRHADAVVYPSIVEGFGLVPFEAAAVGTPCLVPAQTATAEMLGETRAAVHSWSPDEWAARLATLLADPVEAGRLIDEVAAVAARHTWQACALATWAAIDRSLALPRRALHVSDGGRLAHVDVRGNALGARLRFTVARGIPAVSRRAAILLPRHRAPGET